MNNNEILCVWKSHFSYFKNVKNQNFINFKFLNYRVWKINCMNCTNCTETQLRHGKLRCQLRKSLKMNCTETALNCTETQLRHGILRCLMNCTKWMNCTNELHWTALTHWFTEILGVWWTALKIKKTIL